MKNFSLLLLTCFFIHTLFAQRFMQGNGLTASFLYGKNKTINPPSSFWLPYTTVTYFPRYNFVEKENSSISIGTPVGLGFGFVSDPNFNKSAITFAYNLSVALDYNIGCKSTRVNPKHFGGYFGTGFDYFHVGGTKFYTDFKGATYGPMIRGGMRFLFSKGRMVGHALNTGLFYKKGLEERKVSTIGLNLLWD